MIFERRGSKTILFASVALLGFCFIGKGPLHATSPQQGQASNQAAPPKSQPSGTTPATKSKPQPAQPTATKKTASSPKKTTKKSSTKKPVPKPRGQKAIEPQRIADIQTALAKVGLYKEQTSGKWDAATTEAMKQYQRANGFKVTGKPDALSLKKMGL